MWRPSIRTFLLLVLMAGSAPASILVLKSGERIQDVAFVAQSGIHLKVILQSGSVKLVPLEQLDLTATSKANGRRVPPAPSSNGTGKASASGSIRWTRNYDEAIRYAGRSNKPIVLFVYTKWCGFCRKMDHEVFINGGVVQQSKDFVYLRLDAEDGAGGTQVARRYGVSSYPATFILDRQGTVLGRIPGFVEASRFIRTLEQFRS